MKKKLTEETKDVIKAVVNDQSGAFIQEFLSLEDAFAFAGENGYQVVIK